MGKERGTYHKYTESERNEIKRLYEEDSKSMAEIARLFSIPYTSVVTILKGRKPKSTVIRYPKRQMSAIIDTEVVEPMPRKISGEDLKRENKDLREENEYLKDKLAYLESLYEISMKEKAGEAQKKRDSRPSLQQSMEKEEKT